MTNKPLIILGSGGHASVLTEILLRQQKLIIGYTAPQQQQNTFGIPYLGQDEDILRHEPDEVELVLGLGMLRPTSLREKLYKMFKEKGYMFTQVIHESAIIAPSVVLGEGIQLMAGVIVQTNSIIADNTIINTGAIVDHDCHIQSHVHIAPGTKISGDVQIGTSTHIGTGTTIIQGVTIGHHCLIGAGAVVVRSISDGVTAFGVPAKEV